MEDYETIVVDLADNDGNILVVQMNAWYKLVALTVAMVFTALGTFTLIMMNRANDYMFCWYEQVHIIRIIEIGLGVYASAYMFYLMTKAIGEYVNGMEKIMEREGNDVRGVDEKV